MGELKEAPEAIRQWRGLLDYCKRHASVPDLHSFTVSTQNGTAFVEYSCGAVCIEEELYDSFCRANPTYGFEENRSNSTWSFSSLDEAAELLDQLGADPISVEM